MVYLISVDGEEKRIEVELKDNSRKADNDARKKIIDYYLDEEGAGHVSILKVEE